MESKIKIFETGIKEGIMSRNKKFYPENMSQEEINKIFLETRIKAGRMNNFDGTKIFQANQKTATNNVKYRNGKYIVLNDKHMKKEDYWYENLPADILIISNKYPNVVVGNQMADCPIIIAEDRKLGVTALAHCGASYIDRKLPEQTVEALQKEYNSKTSDIYIHITSCASKNSYIYDCYPNWATNKDVWKDSIVEKNGNYYIDMRTAIINQLKEKGVANITYSTEDTVTSSKFYSHSAYARGNNSKKGQNFVGFYYINQEK